jgi:hypothetical protein
MTFEAGSTEDADPALLEILQQVTVVAGDLDDERGFVQTIALDHLFGVAAAVAQP